MELPKTTDAREERFYISQTPTILLMNAAMGDILQLKNL
jgi:hypothetical protein